jgi:hypothetical protein
MSDFLSVYLYVSICQSVSLSVCLSVWLFVYFSACLSLCLCLSFCQPTCFSICDCLYVSLSFCLPVFLSLCLCNLCVSICIYVCLSVCLCVCLLVCLPVYISLNFCSLLSRVSHMCAYCVHFYPSFPKILFFSSNMKQKCCCHCTYMLISLCSVCLAITVDFFG